MRGAGMVVVSLKGVNFGFWYNFGCSGHSAIIVVAKVSFRVVNEEICACFNMVSFRSKKAWAMPRLVSFKGL